MNQNLNEFGLVLSSQETPPANFEPRIFMPKKSTEIAKEKINKTPLQDFMFNLNEIPTDTEMLNEDS